MAVDDVPAMEALSQAIVAKYGALNGVIHSAGVLRDSLLANKTDAELHAVLQPKVGGLVGVDEATREMSLDWLVLCSSVASVWGNGGQVDYAAGNGFLDGYAAYREALAAQGLRRGRTVSVSWPLWAAGGMRVDAAGQERMRRLTGMQPLADEAGIAALAQGLSIAMGPGSSHVLVLHGERERLLARLQAAYDAKATPLRGETSREVQPEAGTTPSGDAFAGQLERALTGLISAHLKIARERLDRDTPLSEFGFDSITLTSFGNVLNQRYGLSLSPTVFFEAPTIAALAAYLAREHGAALAPAFAAAPAVQRAAQATQSASPGGPAAAGGRRRVRKTLTTVGTPAETASPQAEPIAVIGMSGCFPEAADIDALWANLQAGRDSIGELPASRWGGGPAPTVRRAGVIEGVEEFDPLFFGISPREAQGMDPQQRLLMTYVYRALEDAGYSVQSLSGSSTALLVGTGTSGYGQMLTQAGEVVTGSSAAGVVGSMGPNRMSYWLDWHGPSEPVETACSSSLVAVHRAMMLLRSGQCGLAVVGGVNTLLSAEAHESFTQAGMLSADGRCKAFSAQANGYVRGEGVGMLVLKPLSAAQRDGDHIYGLILGSSQNHGGRANSLTAPNPVAQAQLVEAAFRDAGVDARTVGYIEAHGTGTALGDPIEVQGLKRAFRSLAGAQGLQGLQAGSIGLGTIKSNIGHLELAAGVAGLIKVLLQMRHKHLVKSLHGEPLNPRIDLEDSPFYVVNEGRAWEALVDATGRVLPRRAGVSSFGFGGVNAHVVLEEYEAPASAEPAVGAPVAVVLSARTAEQLRAQVGQLRVHLETHEINLADLAYTLQVGRDALGVRLALVVGSVEELKRKLLACEQGETSLEDVYRGEVKRSQEMLAVFTADEDMREVVGKWLVRGKVGKLAELWVQGLSVDWSALYGESRPRRVSLPTYPFAKERYWVPEHRPAAIVAQQTSPLATAGSGAVALHPLVHRNTSTLHEQRYSTWLTGEEFFLRDHVVQGQRVAPGVVQLEWARAAVSLALGGAGAIRLEQVSWVRRLAVAEPLEVHIGLEVEDDGRIGYEIYSGEGEAAEVYSQGWAVVSAQGEAPSVDLAGLRGQCGRTISGADCYARFASMGLNYGPSFQSLMQLQVGDRGAIGSLQGPGHVPQDSYCLPPSLLDGALQASLGLMPEDAGPALPFAVRLVEQWAPVPSPAYVVVRPAADDSTAVRKLDVEIVDAQGRVAVRLSGFTSRLLPSSSKEGRATDSRAPAAMAQVGELTLAPIWEAVGEAQRSTPPPVQQMVQLHAGTQAPFSGLPVVEWSACDSRETLVERLRREGPLQHVVWRVPVGEARVAVMGLRLVQALLALDHGTRSLGLTIVTRQALGVGPNEASDPDQASVHGLVGALAKEYPRWRVSLLDLPKDEDLPLAALLAQPADAQGDARAWRAGRWHRQVLVPCALPEAALPPYREGGVYVVLGGAGGIGVALSEHLIRRYRAQLVWLGRRAEDEAIGQHRARLGKLGPTPLYLQADATDQDALELAHMTIRERFGAIHGVVHAAIVLADRSLALMDEATFEEALTAKAATAENLDAVFGDEALDFLVFFSSLQSFMKAPGQSNYAAGCCYADAFAQRLRQRSYPVKLMHWGYWGSVGVVASNAYRERMAQAGIGSIEPPEAMAVLDRLLGGPVDQVVFVKTTQASVARSLGVSERATITAVSDAPSVLLRAPLTRAVPEALLKAHRRLDSRAIELAPHG